jgi:hypothetical protein
MWPCADSYVSVTFLFGAAIGPFTRNLMHWVHEEGFCDQATRDKDWIGCTNLLFTGVEPLSEYERLRDASPPSSPPRPRPSCSRQHSSGAC